MAVYLPKCFAESVVAVSGYSAANSGGPLVFSPIVIVTLKIEK
ncbi:MAG: hypothetical protein ACJAV5_000833 [Vicingaceae bacterium]|jgi:hypothetical protein